MQIGMKQEVILQRRNSESHIIMCPNGQCPRRAGNEKTGRVIGKSSATYQLVRSSSEHPSSSWWEVDPAAFVSLLLPWLCNTDKGILKEKLFISASSSSGDISGWKRLGGRSRTEGYITVVVGKQERRGSGNHGRKLKWSHHSLGSGPEMVTRHWHREMNCPTTRWVSHKRPGLNSSSRLYLHIRTSMLFPTDKQVFPIL